MIGLGCLQRDAALLVEQGFRCVKMNLGISSSSGGGAGEDRPRGGRRRCRHHDRRQLVVDATLKMGALEPYDIKWLEDFFSATMRMNSAVWSVSSNPQ